MTEKSNISRLTFLIILGALSFMFIQGTTKFPKNNRLAGTLSKKDVPSLSLGSWIEMDFQSAISFNVDKDFGFRPSIVRFFNELRYRLFNEFNRQVVVGDDGYLFERGYRKSVCGLDFLGEEQIQLRVDSLESLRLKLEGQGKKLLLFIPPNKWRAHEDKVDWDCKKTNQTNYHVFCEKLYEQGFYLFDHMDYFRWEMKSTPYPMYSKQGTHWSIYGAAVSSLSVIASFRSEGIEIPSVSFESIELSSPRNTDKDLHDLLNIMSHPEREGDSLAYPTLGFKGEEKPRVLIIGDSYYWTYYYLGLHQGLFHPESKYFYYNSTMIGQDGDIRTPVTSEIRSAELEASDVVLLVMCEPSLADFGYGLLEQTLD